MRELAQTGSRWPGTAAEDLGGGTVVPPANSVGTALMNRWNVALWPFTNFSVDTASKRREASARDVLSAEPRDGLKRSDWPAGGSNAGIGTDRQPLAWRNGTGRQSARSEEHTSELQSPCNLVCR